MVGRNLNGDPMASIKSAGPLAAGSSRAIQNSLPSGRPVAQICRHLAGASLPQVPGWLSTKAVDKFVDGLAQTGCEAQQK
jgi:hypothetical protein